MPGGTLTLSGNTGVLQPVPSDSHTATVTKVQSEDPSPSSPLIINWSDIQGKPTFGTASSRDVPAAGNAATNQVVLGTDTRLTDARPTTPGQITGATATGIALLTASSASNARAALGASVIGDALFTAATALDVRNAAGVGTIATQNANAVALTGGTIAGVAITGGTVSGLTSDLAVADGGTGASTASGARTNLGSTAVGDALFIAASAAAARTTLGAGTVGGNIFQASTIAAVIALLFPGLVLNGQCYFEYVSATQCQLVPFNGNTLFVNGQVCTIPSGGVQVSNASLSANTVYNAYAVQTSNVITSIEFSATARATDTTYGNQIKNGDATRVLVGKVRTNASSQFYQTANDNGVISWFNQRNRTVSTVLGSNQATSSTTDVAIFTGPLFLTWGLEEYQMVSQAIVTNSVDQAQTTTSNYIDGAVASMANIQGVSGAGGTASVAAISSSILAEGNHTSLFYGRVNAGTGTWLSSSNIQIRFRG